MINLEPPYSGEVINAIRRFVAMLRAEPFALDDGRIREAAGPLYHAAVAIDPTADTLTDRAWEEILEIALLPPTPTR